MRFMVIVKASKESEAGIMPTEELMTAMGAYNEELMKAGVLVAGDGLQSSAKGARVKISGESRSVAYGPFPLTSDLIAGYWIFEVNSLDEAIEWVKKAPNPMPGQDSEIEIRPFFELENFGDEMPADLREREQQKRDQLS